MKNLTHYFKSPKEDETDQKVKKTELPIEIVEEKAPPKKRRIRLSKSKKKKSESPEDKQFPPENSHNIQEAQSKTEKYSPEKLSGKNNKKRKTDDESNSSCKKMKTTKSLKINVNKSGSKNKESQDVNSQTAQYENSVKHIKSISPVKTEDNEPIVLEDSLSSDEPLLRTNRNPKKNLLEDSDYEAPAVETQSPPSAGKVKNNETSCHKTSRKSLFGYFNKVDKETALKQQISGKIEVKAIVHSSPSGTKTVRKSLDKITLSSTAKKHKNKFQLDNSDSIEVISSEEVTDENSSNNGNVPLKVDQDQRSSLSPSIENIPNKPKPSNLASIFMPKKISLQAKTVENISLTKAEIEIPPVEETQKVQREKEPKTSKQAKALSRSYNCTKISKGLQKEKYSSKIQSINNVTERYSSFETISQQGESKGLSEDNSSTLKINGFTNTLLTANKFVVRQLNSPSSEKPSDEKNLLILESPKAAKSTKTIFEGKTPDKTNFLKINNDEEITPKKKGSTINGYFTQKSNNLNSTNTESFEKCTKSVKSPWVMKVCLNSASKMKVDSDEDDDTNSQDSCKGESETISISQEELGKIEENDIIPPVIVIHDDNSSTEVIGCNDDGKRRSLPRNAKKPNLNIEEDKEEEIKEVKPQTSKPTVKMWPFFQKGGARPAKEAPTDEVKLKAKMLFLESGVPEIIKRKVETVKSDIAQGPPAPFPTVSHVVQAAEKTSNGGADSMNLPLPHTRSVSPLPAMPAWTPVFPTDSPVESEIPVFKRVGNVKAFLEKLKEEEPKTEVKVLYKKLKEYKSKAESDIWTEVYKPTNSADMVGNSENIKKLKTWLETLKNCRKREGSISSGDEFVNEDSDGDDSSFNNMALICGPCGCGKTSAVYAIAKELDIKVLEINASCNRSGKRILAEFSESTQSHHVERSQPTNGFFNNQSSGKKKRKKLKISEKLKSEKTSLILVEDADLLFTDCDEGFVPALASLAASSKRPIVLVTNQESTPHLDRFNNSKLLRVTFNRPRPNKLSLWLRLVGLVEGVMMTSGLALRLVTVRNCDVRRCLLDLQLMVHSNNSEVKDKLSPSRLWWGWPSQYQLSYELPTLLEPEEEGPKPEVDKRLVLSQLQSVASTSRRLACLDVLSVSSREECLENHEDPCPLAWAASLRDSTALTTPLAFNLYPSQEATWLQQALAKGHNHSFGHEHRTGQTPQEARWLSILRQGEQFFMSGITTTAHTSHQSVTCDYLPTLRELARSEQVRLANYTRRANRFFNYLQGLGVHASKSYRDFMCDAFS